MPRTGLGAARRALDAAQARRLLRRAAADEAVRVCWDLDNTLLASGALAATGTPLERAWVEAGPVAGMVEFAAALAAALPEAAHYVLSARPRGMREATLLWLSEHVPGLPAAAVALVPRPSDKPRIWRDLARGAQLVVVDDLSHGHECGAAGRYDELIAQARAIAALYVSLEDIATAAEPGGPQRLAERVAAELRAR